MTEPTINTNLPRLSETTKNEFSLAVETKAAKEGLTYLAALAEVLNECHIDPEKAGKLVNKSLKDKIEAEALQARMLKGARDKGANVFSV